MGAIRVHHTDTDNDSEWDGPGEVAAAPNDAGVLRYMHTWEDPDGDAEAKSTYKFPHHKAGGDTEANIRGVNNALARLSQADIPEGDRAGVEAHLRAHRVDAGLEDEEGTEDRLRAGHPKTPIRCFEGNAQPHEAFWNWRNIDTPLQEPETWVEQESDPVQSEGEPEMELYGYISEFSWWDDDITPRMFKDDLYRYGKGGPITVRMNSGGGDLIAASVIKAILMDYPGRVTVKIDGLAASAATLVAIAGNRVWMNESAYFMVHDPLVAFMFAVLNIEELSKMLDSLKTAKNGILDAYITRTGQSRERLARMMSNETWLTASEAVDNGFADKVLKVRKGKPQTQGLQNAAIVNALHNYVNVPASLLAPAPPQAEPVSNAAAERLRAEVKLYV